MNPGLTASRIVCAASLVAGGLLGALFAYPGRAAVTEGNWPAWRGDGSGISEETGLPISWSATENVLWKVEVNAEGHSSPIVWGNRVFLTGAKEAGKRRLVLCFDADTGQLLWEHAIELDEVPSTYSDTGYAPATPATDGTRIYAFFEGVGLIVVDMEGNLLWTVPLGPFNNYHSIGSSPVVYKDMVLVCCDQQAEGFIAAYDGATGAQRWRMPRNLRSQWSTPLVFAYEGHSQVVVGGPTVISYDADTGDILWSCQGLSPNVAPTPVFARGLVWATSGRNGPTLAIEPSGRGDVTGSAVRLHHLVGGPYVPSPIVYPLLALPGDNGHLRFLSDNGEQVAELRLKGPFFASPVGAEQRLYWNNEKGDTYVIDVSGLTQAPPQVRVLSVNSVGEGGRASLAIAGGRVYLRTHKHLYCFAGQAQVGPAAPSESPAVTFAELKDRFAQHPRDGVGPEDRPDVIARIQIVEAMGELRDPEVVPFLSEVTRRGHWDVCEAAAKALSRQGPPAWPALRSLLEDDRDFMRITAADALGRQGDVEAVPGLVTLFAKEDAPSRIAAITALAGVGAAHAESIPGALPTLLQALGDPDALVRKAAVEGLGRLAEGLGEEQERVIAGLLQRLGDPSPLVAEAAQEVLTQRFGVPPEKIQESITLYGAPRAPATVRHLRAGPFRLKFQDGELRYLYVGDREVVRRVYFAVRDSRWDTPMPDFQHIEIQEEPDGFRIGLSARCQTEMVDYSWTGEIIGSVQGEITFRATGVANRDFESPRIGINVLFGSDSLAGVPYGTTDAGGTVTAGVFPQRITLELLTGQWSSLTYHLDDGLELTCRAIGAEFGMEDQRKYCDSSYKAFSALPYAYPLVPKGEEKEETVVLKVEGAKPPAAHQGPVRVLMDAERAGGMLPQVVPLDRLGPPVSIFSIRGEADKFKDAAAVTLSFNPAIHLSDEDTLIENLTNISEQVQEVRLVAPGAAVSLGPVGFDSIFPRPGPDPRHQGRFAAAWAAAALLESARAGVREVGFKLGAAAQPVLEALATYGGRPLINTRVFAAPPAAIRAQAVSSPGCAILWLVNQTAEAQQVLVGLPAEGAQVRVRRFVAEDPPAGPVTDTLRVADNILRLTLEPYEVCEITAPAQPSAN